MLRKYNESWDSMINYDKACKIFEGILKCAFSYGKITVLIIKANN